MVTCIQTDYFVFFWVPLLVMKRRFFDFFFAIVKYTNLYQLKFKGVKNLYLDIAAHATVRCFNIETLSAIAVQMSSESECDCQCHLREPSKVTLTIQK